MITRNKEKKIQTVRFVVQTLFAVLCIWIGIEFYHFVQFVNSGGLAPYSQRPPGVEGFLPISSFMSFYFFLSTGQIHFAHPAGLFIFSAILLISLTFGKSFCSWFCPVGFISELIGDFGKKIFKKDIILPKWIDYPLRSLKYLLLGFLFYAVFFLMSIVSVKAFLDSPYNIVSDLKMFYFFADISRFSLIVIGSLFFLSIIIRNFWCRYLCPYGALLGLASLLSPNKIKRNTSSCIDCGLCSKACPSHIKVDKVKTVVSDECSTCLSCVDACPVENTLQLENLVVKKKINKRYVAIGVVSIFMIITGAGMLTGNWQNNVSPRDYIELNKHINEFGHPTNTKSIERFNRETVKKRREKKPGTKKKPITILKGEIKDGY